jgi:hypothetical protein
MWGAAYTVGQQAPAGNSGAMHRHSGLKVSVVYRVPDGLELFERATLIAEPFKGLDEALMNRYVLRFPEYAMCLQGTVELITLLANASDNHNSPQQGTRGLAGRYRG